MNHLFQHIQGHLYGAFRPRLLPTGGATAFSPLSLFAANEQGVWYDPSDFASMFQDAAGTTPVTAVEQPVGLILDKRLGLALGAELLTNGDFSNGTTGWEAWNVNAQISVSGGQMTVTQPVGGNQVGVGNSAPFTTVVGRTYMVQLDIISYVGSNAPQIRIGYFNGSAEVNMLFAAGTGTRYAYFVATATSTHVNVATSLDAGSTITFDNISVREIPGNHATQATAAARPVVSARVNLLLDSDGHAGATITPGTGLVVVATGLTDQRGGLTARQIRNTTTNEQHRLYTGVAASPAPYTVWVKNVDAGWVQLTFAGTVIAASGANFNLADGTVGTIVSSGAMPTASIVAEGGFYKCTITPHSSETGISNVQLYVIEEDIGLVNPHIAGTEKSVIIGGAQLGAGTYQRVTTATDYDTVGFPHYLVFDGVDDALLVGTVALPADADATVGAWRDTANNGMIFTRAALSSEFFGVYDPGSAASSTATAGAPTYAVNGTAVPGGAAVTRGQMHTAFTVASPCVVEALNLDLSAFTALNIGGYGASFSLVGRLYGVVICPAQQAATRTSLRQYLASKSGATL